ncbi:MAG: hypothetical protein H7X91_11775 [Burkholderiales bacterium]|nr:hypothetical protein [Burkholderiales bacterium]
MTPKAKAAGLGTRTAFRTAHETHHSARPNDEQGGRDLYAIEMRLPHEVELAIRRLDYRKVATMDANDVAAKTLRKLERYASLDADALEYLRDGACFLALDALRGKWGLR